MLLRTKGKSINIHSDEVKIVTRFKSNLNKDNVIIVDEIIQHLEGDIIQLTESNIEPQFDFTGVYAIKTLEHLDIVKKDLISIFKKNNIGCYNWGLVAGKSQTHFGWETIIQHEEKRKKEDFVFEGEAVPEPKIWFHDIFRQDGSAYDSHDVKFIKDFIKSKKNKLIIYPDR